MVRMKTIFVSIASYRDSDIGNTVSDLFSKAKFPSRVQVGVFLQVDPELDKDCYVSPRKNLRYIIVPPSVAKGAGWARGLIQQTLYDDEDFYFQVDSHMRFEQDWDEKLVNMSEELPENSVISTYPLPFTPPFTFNAPRLVRIKPKKFDTDGVLLQCSGMFELKENVPCERTPFISAGMYFAPRHVIKSVPVDPYIYFTGEEISTGLRLFTHGYDVYIPNKVIAYHNYNPAPERARVWTDQDGKNKRSALSRSRVLFLCGQKETVDTDALININTYGLGNKRPISKFEQVAKIDFRTQEIYSK